MGMVISDRAAYAAYTRRPPRAARCVIGRPHLVRRHSTSSALCAHSSAHQIVDFARGEPRAEIPPRSAMRSAFAENARCARAVPIERARVQQRRRQFADSGGAMRASHALAIALPGRSPPGSGASRVHRGLHRRGSKAPAAASACFGELAVRRDLAAVDRQYRRAFSARPSMRRQRIDLEHIVARHRGRVGRPVIVAAAARRCRSRRCPTSQAASRGTSWRAPADSRSPRRESPAARRRRPECRSCRSANSRRGKE